MSRSGGCSEISPGDELDYGLEVGQQRAARLGERDELPVPSGRAGRRDAVPADGLGLADAIGLLRDELLAAQAAGAGSDIQLPIESMTVELKVTATRSVDGKAGFRVPIVDLELGGGAGRERGSEQTVTVVFGGPVDRDGHPVKVAQESARRKG